SMKRIRASRTNLKPQTAEDLVAAGVVIVGSPATVREKLEEYQALARFNTSLTKTQFGTMSVAQARENTAAVAEEILPHFQDKQPAGAAAE
ncbi:MAG: hypothetical protein RIM80_03765, partial [Alphaproteobacteria bacterium]